MSGHVAAISIQPCPDEAETSTQMDQVITLSTESSKHEELDSNSMSSPSPSASPSPSPPPPPIEFSLTQLLIVYSIIVADAFALNIVTPFISNLVREQYGVSEGSVGVCAGLLVGGFSLAVFFSSFFLGHLSDLYGRKPLMLVGLITGGVTTILLPVTTSFTLALFLRLIGGFTNANLSITKAVISDAPLSAEKRAFAFAMLGAAFQTARAIASAVAALTTGLQVGQYKNDFFLPCLIAAIVNFITLIFAIFKLPETLKKKKSLSLEPSSSTMTHIKMNDSIRDSDSTTSHSNSFVVPVNQSIHITDSSSHQIDDEHAVDHHPSSTDANYSSKKHNYTSLQAVSDANSSVGNGTHHDHHKSDNQGEEREENIRVVDNRCQRIRQAIRYHLSVIFSDLILGFRLIRRDPLLFRLIFISCINSFSNGAFILLIALYSTASRDNHGLGFNPFWAGSLYVWFGVVSVGFQLGVYKKVYRKFGLVATYKKGSLAIGISCAFLSLAGYFPSSSSSPGSSSANNSTVSSQNYDASFIFTLCYCYLLIFFSASGFMTCLPVLGTMLSNAATASRQGLTQGVAQSLQSGSRGVGGVVLGMFFSFCTAALHTPIMVFIILTVLNFICFLLARRFPDTDIQRIERRSDTSKKVTEGSSAVDTNATQTTPDVVSESNAEQLTNSSEVVHQSVQVHTFSIRGDDDTERNEEDIAAERHSLEEIELVQPESSTAMSLSSAATTDIQITNTGRPKAKMKTKGNRTYSAIGGDDDNDDDGDLTERSASVKTPSPHQEP